MFPSVVISLLFFVAHAVVAATTPDLEDQARAIAAELRCVVCQNLSVADSPSEMAQQMRAVVREQLQAGKSPEAIKDFFVSKYGEWVLLKPKTSGVSLLLWLLPYVALVSGMSAALWLIRRWTRKRATTIALAERSDMSERLRGRFVQENVKMPALEDSTPRAQLLRERARLRDELTELDFDYQAGKLSENDVTALRNEIEKKGALVLQQLDALPTRPDMTEPKAKSATTQKSSNNIDSRARFKRWQLIAGAAFLLLFGLALGVLLTQSIRPRGSEQDSITGDFLTGTSGTTGSGTAAFLQEGKAAFEKQEWPRAIEAFKKVLAAEPNQPEAHTYMGLILLQANHADGALLAFDKALAVAPNLPMALWGKGMTLYREKQDYAGAREVMEKLLKIIPPGAERTEVEKVLAELRQPGQPTPPPSKPGAQAAATAAQITGKITIDDKLKANIDGQAVLFIIARSASAAAGPPLAVKKIDRPLFPLSYSLGAENVMMQGTPFSGKVTITARLDKDGNSATRQPGDLSGAYKKNPVDVGSNDVDVVLDQVTQ